MPPNLRNPKVEIQRIELTDKEVERISRIRKRRLGPGSWDGEVPWERNSLYMPEATPEDEEDFIREEILRFAPMCPRPLSMTEALDMLEPDRIAKFLHVEVPIRVAERIRDIEGIEGWQDLEELATVHEDHVRTFRDLRLVKRAPGLEAFTTVVEEAVQMDQKVPKTMTKAMHRLHSQRGEAYGSTFADAFLDKFLLSWIGTKTLMTQYLACTRLARTSLGDSTFAGGIIDPDCDVAQICRETADMALNVTKQQTGLCPTVSVDVFQERGVPRFQYIPEFLKYILMEVLKNSCQATVNVAKSDAELQERPIQVIVCADDHYIAIRIVDRANGIPFEVGSQVWSYLYTTAGSGDLHGEDATSPYGFGVGLPLSRLFAQYLGGHLSVVSLPGYGTSVDLFLARGGAEQVERVPDSDLEFQ